MKPVGPLSRRSFLTRVAGASAFALGACTYNGPIDESPYDPPGERGRRPERPSCTDGDSGRYHDAPGQGRSCRAGQTRRRPPRRD